MIERHWKGVAKKESAAAYITHLQNDTFKQLATITGFIAAKILERNIPTGVEFLIITVWRDVDAIKNFAGAGIEKAVVPEVVQRLMVSYDEQVTHYKTISDTGTDKIIDAAIS